VAGAVLVNFFEIPLSSGARGQKIISNAINKTMDSIRLDKEASTKDLTETQFALRAKQGGNYDCRLKHRIYRSNWLSTGHYDSNQLCELCGTLLHWSNDPSPAEIEDSILERLARIAKHEAEYKKESQRKTSHAGHELGAREFTLTYSPKWFDDSQARERMTMAIQKLQKYYKDEIVKFVAVGETGSKDGLSHVHCFYELRGGLKITDKNFKRAYPWWNPKIKLSKRGFQGGHHEVVKNLPDFAGYIEKQNNPWLIINNG